MKNNSTIGKRIGQLIDEMGYNKSSFSNAIGLTNNVTIGRIVNEEREPSYNVILKITQTFGSVNADWLLKGEGPMLKQPSREDKEVIKESPPGECPYCREKDKVIQSQGRHIETLTRQLDRCQDELDYQKDHARHRKDDGQKRKAG